MKILYVTTIGATMPFFKSFIRELIESGHKVDIATNIALSPVADYFLEWGCNVFPISCTRNPLDKTNLKVITEIKSILQKNKYDIVHCHTPVAAMLTRLAARKSRKNGTRVIYTAHGFHFFKGAPLKNWIIYFPVEWLCSFLTDTLITINQEDFAFAKKHLHAKKTEYVPGVGVDVEKFKNTVVNREEKRKELGIPKDSIAVLSVGELNDNKNHETVLKAIAKLDRKDIVYIICGVGNKKEYLENLAAELGMSDRLIFAGFRTDVAEIYKCCDIFAFPSKREGLPVSVMEAMASGLPCVASDIRGARDLIKDGENGFLCEKMDIAAFSEKIALLADDKALVQKFALASNELLKVFDIKNVTYEVTKIYEDKK